MSRSESGSASESSVSILVAEDSISDRMILETMLRRGGHNVSSAEDGAQAVELFRETKPDLVFLDVMMPNMNGIEAAKKIKELSGDEFIPVVFLTSLADAKSLATCLESGGDDFLSKPFNPIVLEAKIKAFQRMREMNQTMIRQKNLIETNNKHLLQEQTVAKQVFDKIAHSGTLDLPIIRYYMSALAVFNGDVLLADISPMGSLFVILGDFTGHGLPAAIGSMPLASTFHGMVGKGFTLNDIIREINGKLHATLPVGLFCCASCIDINFSKRRMLIWSGGLPDGALYRKNDQSVTRIASKNLPLGVLPNREFNAEPLRFDLEEGDHLLLWSDGIQEARSAKGDMFGEDRLNAILDQECQACEVFENIISSVQNHIGEGEEDDDLSLVDIVFPDKETAEEMLAGASNSRGRLADWKMSLQLNASSLRNFDPMPLLVNITSEVPGLRQNSSILYTVLSELYNNAVEHGVLGLESSLKASAEGFAQYYRLRDERLESLSNQWVTIEFEHQMEDSGGLLIIRMLDSGEGFDATDTSVDSQKPTYFGRGLTLISQMCEKVNIIPPGNIVEAHFRWNFEG